MLRKSVESNSIASIGYDKKLKILEVEFIGDTIYQYFNVPKQVADAFMYSPFEGSYGKHFNKHLKDMYDYQKLT